MKKILFAFAMSGLLIFSGSFTKPLEELKWYSRKLLEDFALHKPI